MDSITNGNESKFLSKGSSTNWQWSDLAMDGDGLFTLKDSEGKFLYKGWSI